MRTVRFCEPAHLIDSGLGELITLEGESSDPRVISDVGEGWADGYTRQPLVDGPIHVGRTRTGALPAEVTRFEAHGTAEVLLGASAPVGVVLAPAGAAGPELDSAVAVRVRPQDVLVIRAGVWHSAAYGAHEPATYCWLGGAADPGRESWVPVEPPVYFQWTSGSAEVRP